MAQYELHPNRVQLVQRPSMESYMVRIYTGPLSQESEFISVEAEKTSSAIEIVRAAVRKLRLGHPDNFEIAEVFSSAGQLCKERRLEPMENPVRVQLLWPKVINAEIDTGQGLLTGYRFYIRKKDPDATRSSGWVECKDASIVDTFLMSFLRHPLGSKEYPDLCNLPDLNEITLLENLKLRFASSNIYTYVGSILIAVNPFKFFPIYNPKYVKMYQNKRLGELPPHIFAIADAAYYTMLRTKQNQCIVISGESGSGKTESTNLLLHHLTALSHKGLHGSGVEQTILGAGPVLEAFGNAKTVHNNNSSRFGKFIQVNYKENGMVHGAIVEKYLLEKSRIVSQAKNERNYHVFYYLLAGSDAAQKESLHLGKAEDYQYLCQSDCYGVEGVDENHEFARLRQSMEMVGFSQETQRRIFSVLSAVLHLGNVDFRRREQHHDESVTVKNEATVQIISQLLKVKERTLLEALTSKKTVAGDETVVINYKMDDAIATRDAMAKCLYGSLFDWIVLKVNQALLAKKHNSEHQGNSIGVLDIFGFEDFGSNSFEQFCINFANEHLQYYFNQHIFKFEQEEYQREGIQWKNIEFIDNTGCLELFSKKANGLFALLDEECNFPGATNETMLTKFTHHHKGNPYYRVPTRKEESFEIVHYAGPVKYHIKDFREKNSDLIRSDIVGVLKKSNFSFVRELVGIDPVAVLRWSVVRAFFRCFFAFIGAGKSYRKRGGSENKPPQQKRLSDSQLQDAAYTDNLLSDAHCTDGVPRPSTLSPMHERQLTACGIDHAVASDDDCVYIKRHGMQEARILESHFNAVDTKVIRKARKLLKKSKSFKPKPRPSLSFRDIKTLKAIANRTMLNVGGSRHGSKKQSPSVGAQFQWSLSRLMKALNQANPFFIRCIKSNVDKAACVFNDDLVLQQLRYTGMLATVEIRQSGYNYRLRFEEFIQQYKILLPKGLLSSKEDVKLFLDKMALNQENYQIGINKLFLRESEKILLDEALHRAIMERVIKIQRWAKTILERQNFIRLLSAVLTLQKYIRRFIAQRTLTKLREERAALVIQTWYRARSVQRQYRRYRAKVILVQTACRGHLARKRFCQMVAARQSREEERVRLKQGEDMQSSMSDEGVLIKESSAEELERDILHVQRRDSEESSGILEDSESETMLTNNKGQVDSMTTPPVTPTSTGSGYNFIPMEKEESLDSNKNSGRVHELAKAFQTPEKDETDGREVFIRRGSQKWKLQKASPAPLATQESFSDLDSQPATPENLDHVFPSPDKIQAIEDAVSKSRDRLTRQSSDSTVNIPPEGQHRSAFGHAMKHFKSVVIVLEECGRRKKDSDEEMEESGSPSRSSPQKRPQDLGVPVLPPYPSVEPPDSPVTPPIHKKEHHVVPGGEPLKQRNGKLKKKRTRARQKASEPPAIIRNWNVAGMSQWQYPAELCITDISELSALDEFIAKKQEELYGKDEGKRSTVFETIFRSSIESFRKELKSSMAVEMQKETVCVRYRDLLANFEHTMSAEVKGERTNAVLPITLGINAFRGFLDEFMKSQDVRRKVKKVQNKPVKRDKHKKDAIIEHLGHKFFQVQFNIPTFCEYCSSLIWIMEKGQVCQVCKYTCHKKCCAKSTSVCKGIPDHQGGGPFHVFGAPLQTQITERCKVPEIAERLVAAIELHGMFTEGLYRKSGAAPKVRHLKELVEKDIHTVDFEEYPIHVLTSTLKCYFRELPEPLLTFDLYDDFLRASEIKDYKEKVQSLFATIERLPKINYDLFERLIFHLARVAMHEQSNKMTANGLAIIFSPCLLRSSKKLQAQESLDQIPRQTGCMECILNEQIEKIKSTLADINTLESAEKTASARLSFVRASIRGSKTRPLSVHPPVSPVPVKEVENEDDTDLMEEERVLSAHIASIHKERDKLTSELPVLEPRHASSDEELLTGDECESSLDPTDDYDQNEEYASTFDQPAIPPSLQHLNKRRTSMPWKHAPRKYSLAIERERSRKQSLKYVVHDTIEQMDVPIITIQKPDFSGSFTDSMILESSYVSIPGLKDEDDEIMV
ncbi:unconventional myosin-IXAa-like isoform X3 [Gigantopelta aegis]|uniref:unconventional myosin-IXAa-like isoform X3 n=1 Tax=Gigantopelta aegis TaxID=1735272 RepID=UPI001B887746|nr:unconventional myosin-IXAa-like isoform X3 [Gigantopelta aegis]